VRGLLAAVGRTAEHPHAQVGEAKLVPAPGEVPTVVLGAGHPELGRLDAGYAEGYADLASTARALRLPAPPEARTLASANLEAAVVAELEAASASQELARRPAGWPTRVPVAAGPVQQQIAGRPPVARRWWRQRRG
jgi:hypothetical protein